MLAAICSHVVNTSNKNANEKLQTFYVWLLVLAVGFSLWQWDQQYIQYSWKVGVGVEKKSASILNKAKLNKHLQPERKATSPWHWQLTESSSDNFVASLSVKTRKQYRSNSFIYLLFMWIFEKTKSNFKQMLNNIKHNRQSHGGGGSCSKCSQAKHLFIQIWCLGKKTMHLKICIYISFTCVECQHVII